MTAAMGGKPPRFELAHMAHPELSTPDMEASLWFFTQLLGVREAARGGGSVYLRCYESRTTTS